MEFYPYSATRYVNTGAYNNIGIWVKSLEEKGTFKVNKQPRNTIAKDFLDRGGERVTDVENIYISPDYQTKDLTINDFWEIDGVMYKTIEIDNRPIRNYCKISISIIDEVANE